MATSPALQTAAPYRPSIYFLDLVIPVAKHKILPQSTIRLHIPSSYTIDEAHAMLDHSERKRRHYTSRHFTKLPIYLPNNTTTKKAKKHILHVDLTSDVLCLTNLLKTTLPRPLSDLLPILKEAHYIATPWTPTTLPLTCRRCKADSTREALALHNHNDVCPKSTTKLPHAWEQVTPASLLSLWPAQFPRLECIYLVVDTVKYSDSLGPVLGPGEKPDVLPEREFASAVPEGKFYDVDSDDSVWQMEIGPHGAVIVARRLQMGYCDMFWNRDVPKCGVLGFVQGEK